MSVTDEMLLRERRCLAEFGLPLFIDFWPDRIPPGSPHMLTAYLSIVLARLARCYWLGLADEARPRIEAMIEWMSPRDPDAFVLRTEHARPEMVPFETRESWWRTLGLCKWLARNDAATDELSRALFARWDKRQFLRPERHARDLASDQAFISRALALALAAKRPEIGAHLYGLVDDWDPQTRESFTVRYGYWACVHLAHGGRRDGDFMRSGIGVLRREGPGASGEWPSEEQLLWLKVLWFDTGMAATAEEAVLREYDVTGSRERPTFLPRRETFL